MSTAPDSRQQHNVSLRGATEWSSATQATVRAAICAREMQGPNKLKTTGGKKTLQERKDAI